MTYCMNWYGMETPILNKVDEINIDISKVKDLGELEEYCEIHKEQRINLCIENFEEAINKCFLTIVFDFQKNCPQYKVYIRLPYYDKDICDNLKENYPEAKIYYYDFIKNWDMLYEYLELKVTDVYIVEELGFEIAAIANIAHSNDTRIRVFPNVAQSAWKGMSDIQKFWIRPEDIPWYEPYVDVFEFWKSNDVYYEIYAIDKKWFGDLSEIIIDLEEHIDSSCILPRFGEKRTRCNRECLKGGKCQICDVIVDLSKNLKDNGFRITIDKEEEHNGERSSSESGSNEQNNE